MLSFESTRNDSRAAACVARGYAGRRFRFLITCSSWPPKFTTAFEPSSPRSTRRHPLLARPQARWPPREQRSLMARFVRLANDLGLVGEEYDPSTNRLAGNFPKRSITWD